MKRKNQIIFISLILLLFIVPGVLSVPYDNILETATDVSGFYERHKELASFIIFSIIFIAIYWIGLLKAAKSAGWEKGGRNAMVALAFALGIGSSWGVLTWQKAAGFLLIDKFGAFSVLLLVMFILFVIGYVVYKSEEGKKVAPFFIALGFIGLYYLLELLFPKFTDKLGIFGSVIDLLFVVLSLYVILATIFFVGGRLTGIRSQKALSDEEMTETEKALAQKSKLKMLNELEEVRKKERITRRSIRNMDSELKQAADILGSLHQAVAQKNPKVIKGDWKKWSGELKKLEKLKVRIGGYAGLIAKILAELIDIDVAEVSDAQRNKLEVFEADLLSKNHHLEENVAIITGDVKKIDETTPANSPIWDNISDAIKNASQLISEIHRDALGALALEQKVREKIQRA